LRRVDDLSRLTTRELATAALFTAILSAAAFVAIPVGSVPFTLQVYVVLLAGLVLGPRLGVLSVLAYLILGLVAPVYAGGTSGLGVLLGPTGGYLVGFIGAALIAGSIAGRGEPTLRRLLVAGLAGLVPVYTLGAAWLAMQLALTPGAAVLTGIVPFVWLDALKAVAAALTARALVSLPLGLPAVPPRDR
jgi:biotin transport system substrate-specific component